MTWLKSDQIHRKVIKIIVFHTLNLVVQNCISLQNQASKRLFKLTTLTSTKAYRRMIIPGRNILSRNIMQTNLGLSWGFASKNHVQSTWIPLFKHGCPCLTLLLVDLTMAQTAIYARISIKMRTILTLPYYAFYIFLKALHMSHIMRKPVYAICEQQRRRSACTSAQSDQRLCCSLPR